MSRHEIGEFLLYRPLKAAGVPEDAALDVACSFGYPELTAVQLTSARPLDDVTAAAWDPTDGGLPADLTEDLSQQVITCILYKKIGSGYK